MHVLVLVFAKPRHIRNKCLFERSRPFRETFFTQDQDSRQRLCQLYSFYFPSFLRNSYFIVEEVELWGSKDYFNNGQFCCGENFNEDSHTCNFILKLLDLMVRNNTASFPCHLNFNDDENKVFNNDF